MRTKYGNIPNHQISSTKSYLQKSIFYLLLYVDPNESFKYPEVNVNDAFVNVFHQLLGFNNILLEPPEVPIVMNSLESARILYNSDNFDYSIYRKLILDAGAKIMEVKEGDR